MPVTYLSKEQQRAAQVRRCLGGAICANGSYKKDLAKNAGMKYHTFLKRLNEPETCTLSELWTIFGYVERSGRGKKQDVDLGGKKT